MLWSCAGSGRETDYDHDKVDEMVLASLYLTAFDEGDAMERLLAKGYISDAKSKAKSEVLGPEGLKRARGLFERHYVRKPELHP
jgi:hypothetical protein